MNTETSREVAKAVKESARWYARQFPTVPRKDIEQESWLAAIEALRTWSPERGRAYPYARRAAFLQARHYCHAVTSPLSATKNGKTKILHLLVVDGERLQVIGQGSVAFGDCLLGGDGLPFYRAFAVDVEANEVRLTFRVSPIRGGNPIELPAPGHSFRVRLVSGSSRLGLHGGERTVDVGSQALADSLEDASGGGRDAWRAELSRVFGSVAGDEEALDAALSGEASKLSKKMRERVAEVMRRLRESPEVADLRRFCP